MPRKGSPVDVNSLIAAIFYRKHTISRINKLIDATTREKEPYDSILHFINEVVIHKQPDTFKKNFIRYTAKPRIKKMIKKELGI